MLVIRDEILKMLVRMGNRENPNQTASSSSLIWVSAVCHGLFGGQLVLQNLEHLLYSHYSVFIKQSFSPLPKNPTRSSLLSFMGQL